MLKAIRQSRNPLGKPVTVLPAEISFSSRILLDQGDMENFTLSLIINDSKETFAMTDVPCFTFTNHLILKVLMVFAYVLVIGTSIIGNTLLAFIYFKSKKMKTTINCCIMNMVLADLLVTLVYMPRMVARILISLEWLVEGTLGLFLCLLVSLSQYAYHQYAHFNMRINSNSYYHRL